MKTKYCLFFMLFLLVGCENSLPPNNEQIEQEIRIFNVCMQYIHNPDAGDARACTKAAKQIVENITIYR
jgi:hypothetical protein